jgi:glyceraldehyde-3-phosphate dehydrogenase (NADP+)
MDSDYTRQLHDDAAPPLWRMYDGESWRSADAERTIDILNPSTGTVLGKVPAATPAEADAVLDRLTAGQPGWETTPLHARIAVLRKAADLFRQHEPELTALLVSEIGKTAPEAKSEIVRSADLIDYYCQEVVGLTGEYRDSDAFPGFPKGRIALIERAAHGVVLAIAPFNYPVNLAVSKIAPALLMGNTLVLKPPTQGSLSGIAITRLFLDAGVPADAMAVVTGSGSVIGDYLVSHPNVRMIAFTGSSETGAGIARKTPMVPLLFECGGNNPVLVMPDADLALTAKEIVKGAFAYAGQRCTGIKYVLATQDVLDRLVPMVASETDAAVHVGDPADPSTKLVGPVISERVAGEIVATVEEALTGGATLVRGGKRNGSYVEPTILTGVKPEMRVVATEVFGPVVSFITVSGTDEAVGIMNRSVYGLQASVFTSDEGTGIAVARRIAVGTVQVNGSPQRGPDQFPFMGIKKSGLGVQGIRYSLEAMSRMRSTVVNFPG